MKKRDVVLCWVDYLVDQELVGIKNDGLDNLCSIFEVDGKVGCELSHSYCECSRNTSY